MKMKMTTILPILMLIFVPVILSRTWTPDLQNGKYQNPIIFADYSDPDVIRVGEDFYMTSSSFGCFPALPILHSE
jgi:beta-xylosidase